MRPPFWARLFGQGSFRAFLGENTLRLTAQVERVSHELQTQH